MDRLTVSELADRYGIRELSRELEREYRRLDYYRKDEALVVALLLKIVRKLDGDE